MSSRYDSDPPDEAPEGSAGGDFQRAVNRLEKAVHEFVGSANDTLSNRATRFMDEAAERLEREAAERKTRQRNRSSETGGAGSDDGAAGYESGRSRRRRHRHRRRDSFRSSLTVRDPGYRTSKLYRDTRRQRIAGVCAGLARYFGVEIWVVRCLAITGVIFMSSIVIPAYIIAWIVLPKAPNGEPVTRTGSAASAASDHSALAPELGSRLSPRHSLRNVQSELDQLELKLRLMESHVTSGQYELQRELRKIDT